MSRTSSREIRVGLAVLVALAGLLGLLVLAGGGPGYLVMSRTTRYARNPITAVPSAV